MKSAFYTRILDNIRKIQRDNGLTQLTLSEYAGVSPSQMSKILRGDVYLSIEQMSKIATGLSLREIDLITWPDVYVPKQSPEAEPLEATLQIKLKKDKKDQVLKLVFGENNLEILNK